MNVWIEWNGNNLPGSFKIKPGEPVNLLVTGAGFWTEHARFRIWDANSGAVYLDQTVSWLFDPTLEMNFITPLQSGTYKYQVTGGINDSYKSNIVTFVIDPAAVEPTPVGWENTFKTIMKWVVPIAVIGVVVYAGDKTGVFDLTKAAVTRKLNK